MTFIVTLLALSMERFFDWTNLRNWSWFATYQRMVVQRFNNTAAYLVLAAVIIPILLAVNLLSFALSGVLYGFATLIFQLVVLIYCLGPQNLWAEMLGANNNLNQTEVGSIFIEANKRIFAVVFWFILLGPVGAVLYRTVSLSITDLNKQGAAPVLVQSARMLEAILNWLPIRAFTLIFALGGHFTKAFNYWRKKVGQGLDSNEILITECGAAALGDEGSIALDGSPQKSAIGLLDRAFVITLVFVAMIAIWV